MAVKTGHEDSLKERGQLGDLFASALVLIRGDKRSVEQRTALRKALQFFLENRLGVVLPGNNDEAPSNLKELLSLPLTEVLPRRISTWCKNQGVKYLGELMMLPADTPWRVSQGRKAIAVRLAVGEFGISPDTDVSVMGWKPPYADDPKVLRALSKRLHHHCNFHMARYHQWPSSDWTCTEGDGCVTVGEYLREYPRLRYHRLSFVCHVLEKEGLHLRMLVPPNWEAPPRDPEGCNAFNKVMWDGVMLNPRLARELLEKGCKTHEDLASLSKKQCLNLFSHYVVENGIAAILAACGLEFAPEPPKGEETPTPIEELELSVRGTNSLRQANLCTVEDVMEKTEAELLRVPNFGRKCLNELREVLRGMNLTLRKV